jgi:ATP-dependent Clp protease ATP-binding subunit ClpA
MTNYKCEETFPCANFQSAICLHCNRRLCLAHITEHNEGHRSSIQNLSNEVEITYQQINNEYEKSRETYNHVLTSLNQWRTQQTEKIQQLYDYYLQSIESQQEALNMIQQDLAELLDRDARQPLKHIHKQQSDGIEIMRNIQQTIEKAQKRCIQLKWNHSKAPPDNVVYDPKDILSIPAPMDMPKTSMIYLKIRLTHSARFSFLRKFFRDVHFHGQLTSNKYT